MTRPRFAVFVWTIVLALSARSTWLEALVCGALAVALFAKAVETWRSVQRTWRERPR